MSQLFGSHQVTCFYQNRASLFASFCILCSAALRPNGEGKKNDRPAWFNQVFNQFLDNFKAGVAPTINLKADIKDLGQGRIESF
jgi:hypothetical protein